MSEKRDITLANVAVDDVMLIEPGRAAQLLLYVIAGLVLMTIIWASVAKLDRVTRGEGRVVTSNQLQEIQYLEGGIVQEILVSPGQKVLKGDVLIKLDPTQINVEFNQGREGYNVLASKIARLESEAALKPVDFSRKLSLASPRMVANEQALYKARKAELDASIEVETRKLDQRREALEDSKVSFGTAQEALVLAQQELEMVERLVEKGIEPQVELLRARQREAAARSDVQRGKIAVNRTEFEIAETEGEIERIRTTFAASAADDLSRAKTELEELKGELPALQDKVARTDIRAPVSGVINRVLVSTIGGVVAPGETIVEIVPSEDTLLVEAKIKPSDIGFLHVGQETKVGITAFDSSVYGSMPGVIETISPDAIEDEKSGESFYTISVRTNTDALQSKRGNLKILPGMAAEVSVLNGKRTVLAYILKPLADISNKAMKDQ